MAKTWRDYVEKYEERRIQRRKKRYAERIAAGLCGSCGNRAPEPGKKACAVCLQAGSKSRKKKSTARRAAGLCPSCGERKPEPGKKICAPCLEADRIKAAKIARERHEAGVCGECGGRREPGKMLCTNCNKNSRQRQADRREAGVCIQCGGELEPGYKTCRTCIDKTLKRQAEMKRAGLCACGRQKPKAGRKTCQLCLDEKNAYFHSQEGQIYHQNYRPRANECARILTRTLEGKYQSLIDRATRKGKEVPLNLTFEQWKKLIASGVCHYCKDSLPEVGFGLDRKLSTLGYTVDNCVPCCTDCNRIRGRDLISYEDMRDIVGPMRRRRGEEAKVEAIPISH